MTDFVTVNLTNYQKKEYVACGVEVNGRGVEDETKRD